MLIVVKMERGRVRNCVVFPTLFTIKNQQHQSSVLVLHASCFINRKSLKQCYRRLFEDHVDLLVVFLHTQLLSSAGQGVKVCSG